MINSAACGNRLPRRSNVSSARQKAIARLDVFASLALVAERNHYVRPVLNEKGVIDIRDGRHPVVEQMTDHDMFISNDTYLDNQKHCIAIITDLIWLVNPPICVRPH